MLSDSDLDELERLAEAATPAPWWIDGLGDLLCRDGRVLGEHYGGSCLVPDESDAAFIAASRTAVPALIAALRAERARAEAAEAKATRLAKMLGEARDSLGAWGAVIRIRGESSLEIDQQVAEIDAALSAVSGLAEKEVGDGNG